jgi:DNA mismatch repair protein MutS
MKIDSNSVFGYYFEVRNTHKDKVPELIISANKL